MTRDPIWQVLYPRTARPEWEHAHRAALAAAESRAKTLGFLFPTEKFIATYCNEYNAEQQAGFTRYEVLTQRFGVWVTHEVVRRLNIDEHWS